MEIAQQKKDLQWAGGPSDYQANPGRSGLDGLA